jgi:type IV secretion system protein VirB1
MIELMALAQQCAPYVAPETVVAVARVESSLNPYAIGVVGGALKRQPANLAEALSTARALERQGRNFSLGIAQVNRYNLPKYGLTYEQAFDPCQNLRVGGKILQECYARALPGHGTEQHALRAAFSCYYSGNFIRGFRPDRAGELSYVQKVVAAATNKAPTMVRVPPVQQADELPGAAAPRMTGVRRTEGSVLVSAAGAESALEAAPAPQDFLANEAPTQPFLVQQAETPLSSGETVITDANKASVVPDLNGKIDKKVVF